MRLPALLTLVLAADAKKHHRNATRWSPRAEFLKRHGPLTGQEAVEAELAKSLRDFAKPQSIDETRAVLKRLLSPDLRNKAAFIYENELFVTKQFLSADKNEGLACMLESAKKRGHAFPTVAWVHNKGASGGDAGTCTKGVEYAIPTTVIAKRDGYGQCGILLPNPYFGENPLKGGMGDLNRWDRVRASIRRASSRSSLERRDSRAFWRGRCYSNERELAPPVTKCHRRKGFVNALLRRETCHTHEERREYLACHYKKGAGNRARLLAAALTATRPDLFDAKCNALDPPRNFSCTRDADALEAALRVVDAVPGRVLDPEHYEKEAYARHAVMLHLPGQTTGSYSRNLNHRAYQRPCLRRDDGAAGTNASINNTVWATGAAVVAWDTAAVEWYYPALVPGEHIVGANLSNAVPVAERLKHDALYTRRLVHGARVVDETFVCADCIASYITQVLNSIRDHMAYAQVLDDPAQFLEIAEASEGACDALRSVVVSQKPHASGRLSDEWTVAKLGERTLCDALRGRRRTSDLTTNFLSHTTRQDQPWAPRTEFLERHPSHLRGVDAIDAELHKSLQDFDRPQNVEDTRSALTRLLSVELRDKAAFIFENELYTTQKFISADKNEGLVCMVASAKKRGTVFPTVAWVHNRGASGGDAGTCTSGVEYSIPTTVIAKRSGYGQCGVLFPNPYFGENYVHGGMGDLSVWEKVRAAVRAASERLPLQRRDARAFWRGRCQSNEVEAALSPVEAFRQHSANCTRFEAGTCFEKYYASFEIRRYFTKRSRNVLRTARRACCARCDADARCGGVTLRPHGLRGICLLAAVDTTITSCGAGNRSSAHRVRPVFTGNRTYACHDRKGAGNRARLLAAALTAARPDLFDARCNALDPPRNFSCVPDSDVLEAAVELVDARASELLDEDFYAKEAYTRHSVMLHLPGQTTGSYSRNLNHLWATGASILMWDTSAVEWYYPALIPGEHLEPIGVATAVHVLEGLNHEKLARGARFVDQTLVAADGIAGYMRRALLAIRNHMAYDKVLDDPRQLLELAEEAGACDSLRQTIIRPKRTQKGLSRDEWTDASLSERTLCDALRRRTSFFAHAADADQRTLRGPRRRLQSEFEPKILGSADASCPRVYVYDLPQLWDHDLSLQELKTASVDQVFGGTCGGNAWARKTNQYGAPLLLLWRVLTSRRCPSVSAEEADLFFVPTYPAPKQRDEWRAKCQTPVAMDLPYLNERTAHRHFFVVGKGHMAAAPCAWWRRPEGLLSRAMRFAYSPQLNATKDQLRSRGIRAGPNGPFDFDDDAVAAEIQPDPENDEALFPHLVSIPYAGSIHASSRSARPPWADPFQPRRYTAVFFGGVGNHMNHPYAQVRKRLSDECAASSDCLMADPFAADNTSALCGVEVYQTATFCFQPGGDTPYRKGLTDCMLSGCIPVVFGLHNKRVAPWFVDESALVVLPSSSYVAGSYSVMDRLRSLPKLDVWRKQTAISRSAHRLQYASGDFPNDAAETLLRGAAALAAKRDAALFGGRRRLTPRDPVVAELERSIATFPQREPSTLITELLSAKLRDLSVFIINGAVYASQKFLRSRKHEGFATLLYTAQLQQGHNFSNVAFALASEAGGGQHGNCFDGVGRKVEVPTLVIAKKGGYDQCGVLVPNPYFGARVGSHNSGDLGLWALERDAIMKAGRLPLSSRIPKVFWRGSCGNHEQRKFMRHRWRPAGSCDVRKEAGNRARLLAASLTVARPDLMDVKCSRLDPPKNFSCLHERDLRFAGEAWWGKPQSFDELTAARDAVLSNRDQATDTSWSQPEDYAKKRFVLNLPGQTTGSYSRNLNHLWATGSVVMLWDTSVVEWYYPALVEGETHLVVNRSTAIDHVERLIRDDALAERLADAARRIDREHLCPDCIARHLFRVVDALRARFYRGVLDDGLGRLAASIPGACASFRRVEITHGRRAVHGSESLCSAVGVSEGGWL